MLVMADWKICAPFGYSVGYEQDNLATTFELATDLTDEWNLKLDVEKCGEKNIIQLTRGENGVYSVALTADMLADNGVYQFQVRGTLGDVVRHSNTFLVRVGKSINATDAFPPTLPSEFTQMEARLTDLSEHPPTPGTNGTWLIWDADKGEYVESEIALPQGVGGVTYKIGHGLSLEASTNTLSVNTVDNFDGDNTLPITASAVQSTVGNIEILLGTI